MVPETAPSYETFPENRGRVRLYICHEGYEQLLRYGMLYLELTICHTPKQPVDAHRCLHLGALSLKSFSLTSGHRCHAIIPSSIS